ncbi:MULTISPECIES: hypothetical protein [unclassified Rhizobium]|uniref:hypothetical protein n=1 Tax=unclassified Rhizobium TaxID=2613769 RepID=UPI00288B7865|nr:MULTISPECIES: hypothetical protein [unclassified Rhizobium]
MKLDDFLNIVATSSSYDWTKIERPVFLQSLSQISGNGQPVPWLEVDEHHTLLSYKNDLRISIATGLKHRASFSELWANGNPDPHASSDWVDFLYNGRPVLRELIVWVDGGRSGLPVPRPSSNKIPDRQYQIWRLINDLTAGGDFDRYFKSAGFEILSELWPR